MKIPYFTYIFTQDIIMETYKIILDEEKINNFISDFLPDLEHNETFYVTLFARKKYCSGILVDKCQLKIFTSNKESLLNKIRQLEIPIGRYYQKNQIPVPQESLAIYLTPNPRDFIKAIKQRAKRFSDLMTQEYNGYNPHQLVLNELQTACGNKYFLAFNFDNVDINSTLLKINEFLHEKYYSVLKTRGCFHILVHINKIKQDGIKTNWYQKISNLEGCDVIGENILLPIPGCHQGGFIPHFIK